MELPAQRNLCCAMSDSFLKGLRPDEITSIINSLAVMGAHWDTLPFTFRESICNRIFSVSGQLSHRELANLVWGLGQVDFYWPRDTKDNITEICCHELASFDSRQGHHDSSLRDLNYRNYLVDNINTPERMMCEAIVLQLDRHVKSFSLFDIESLLSGKAVINALLHTYPFLLLSLSFILPSLLVISKILKSYLLQALVN